MEAFTAALQASDAAMLPLMVHLATDAHCGGSKQHMSDCQKCVWVQTQTSSPGPFCQCSVKRA